MKIMGKYKIRIKSLYFDPAIFGENCQEMVKHGTFVPTSTKTQSGNDLCSILIFSPVPLSSSIRVRLPRVNVRFPRFCVNILIFLLLTPSCTNSL